MPPKLVHQQRALQPTLYSTQSRNWHLAASGPLRVVKRTSLLTMQNPPAFGVSWKGLISLATRLRNSFRSLTTIYNLTLGSLWTIKSCQKEQATSGNYRMISIDCCSSCFLSNYPLLIISINYTRHHGCISSRKIDCYKDFENRNNLLR